MDLSTFQESLLENNDLEGLNDELTAIRKLISAYHLIRLKNSTLSKELQLDLEKLEENEIFLIGLLNEKKLELIGLLNEKE